MSKIRFIQLVFLNTFCLCFLVSFLVVIFYKAPLKTIWINNCFNKKISYANSISDKKIVFASGSNTLYGIETHLVEEVLHIPTVNFGIHAGLKTDYILYKIKEILKKGDIVILPFEYESLSWNGAESPVRTDYILTYDRDFFFYSLNLKEQISMIFSITPQELINSLRKYFIIPTEPNIGKGYNSNTLNKNGDETYKNGIKEELFYKKYKPIKFEDFYETKGLKDIKKFAQWCNENNIILFVTFPNIMYDEAYFKESSKNYFDSLVNYFNISKINIIGKPTEFLYPREYFYDGNYHLNSEGSIIRTMEFLDKLNLK